MHRTVAAALVAALALAVASCGGSGTTTLTRAELVRKVELACREGQLASREKMRAARGDSRTNFIDGVLTSQKTVMEKIEDLDTSGAAKADFDTFKESAKSRMGAIERIAAADRADQQRVIREVQPEAEAASRKMEASARSLGIRGCI